MAFKMKHLVSILSYLIVIIIFVISCEKELFASSHKLGVVLPLTGEFAKTGENLLNAVKLSVEKVATAKNIKFTLVIKDDKNDPHEAEKVAKELVQDPEIVDL